MSLNAREGRGISWIAARGLWQPKCTSRNPQDGSFLPRGLRQRRSRR